MEKMPKKMVKAEVCGNCVNYRQHYVLQGGSCFRPLWYGHCHTPRSGRYPTPEEVCPHYQPYEQEPDSQG